MAGSAMFLAAALMGGIATAAQADTGPTKAEPILIEEHVHHPLLVEEVEPIHNGVLSDEFETERLENHLLADELDIEARA
ncbi:hypothetical protein [Streptomyces sp. NBC_01276]|uniref:hypothetical protein n=1 Tax=Streptomyces sp. NBC_01276 TaxID=2903808 RepID=UPI00352F37B9